MCRFHSSQLDGNHFQKNLGYETENRCGKRQRSPSLCVSTTWTKIWRENVRSLVIVISSIKDIIFFVQTTGVRVPYIPINLDQIESVYYKSKALPALIFLPSTRVKFKILLKKNKYQTT